jgi:hypothetical protein
MTRADQTVAAQVEALQRELAGSIVPDEKSNGELGLDLEDLKDANYRKKPNGNMKRRGSRGFARYLLAICIGVAGTLAWQSYGDAIKQIIAARAPELGWSPQAKQMIASWTVGWAKPPASSPEKVAPETVAPKAPPAASVDPAQVQQIAQSLAALRQSVEQIAAGQDQTSREMARVEAAVAELILKVPEPSAQPPAASEPKPVPVPPSSRAPTAPQSSRTPTPGH